MTKISSQKNDQIDLMELFCVFIAIAGVQACTAKEQWTSTDIMVVPRSTDFGNLLPTRVEYATLLATVNFLLQRYQVHCMVNLGTSFFLEI